MSKVLVVGLNPAWQKVLRFRGFMPGEVNRAASMEAVASGKGLNAARVLRRLGHEVSVLQILGGDNGRRCLEGCRALGIESLHASVASETRQCITLIHGNAEVTSAEAALEDGSTEIIEPFKVDEPGVGKALLGLLPAADAFEAVAVCGTLPPGLDEGFYDAVLARLRARVTIIDAWQGLGAAGLAAATAVKMNAAEHEALGRRLGEADMAKPTFLLTAGEGVARMLRDGREAARFEPPHLKDAVNPIGAGDTVTAGLMHFLLQGIELAEAFRRALALGSASCLQRLPADYSDADYERLLPLSKRIA